MVENLLREAAHRARAELRALRGRGPEAAWITIIVLTLIGLRQSGGPRWDVPGPLWMIGAGTVTGLAAGPMATHRALVEAGSSWRATLPFAAAGVRRAILLRAAVAGAGQALGLLVLAVLLGGLAPTPALLPAAAVALVAAGAVAALSGAPRLGSGDAALSGRIEAALHTAPGPGPGTRAAPRTSRWIDRHPVRRTLLLAANPERDERSATLGPVAVAIGVGILAGVATRKMGVPAGVILLGLSSLLLVTGMLPTLAAALPILRPLPVTGRSLVRDAVRLVSRPVCVGALVTAGTLVDRPADLLVVVGLALALHLVLAHAWVALLLLLPGSSLARGMVLAGWATLVVLVGAAMPVIGGLLAVGVTVSGVIGAVRAHRARDLEVRV